MHFSEDQWSIIQQVIGLIQPHVAMDTPWPLTSDLTVCYLRCQHRHNITNCAREHTTETEAYLKELRASQTLIFLRSSYVKTQYCQHSQQLTVHTTSDLWQLCFVKLSLIKIYLHVSTYLSAVPADSRNSPVGTHTCNSGRDWRLNCLRDRIRPALFRDSIFYNMTLKFFTYLTIMEPRSLTN